jgi:Kdo2-lipid IVA lauroyltransferase/acyltransferase
MSFILFNIIIGLWWLIALLPLKILYFFSDILFLFTYYFPGYRKKTVLNNLRNAFPEKSETEIKVISKKFYHHFNDVLIEILKMIHLSPSELADRIKVKNPEVLNDLYSQNKSVIAVVGHYNNWEWILGTKPDVPYHSMAIYKPLNNKYFNKFIIRNRSRYGVELISMRETLRKILYYKKINKVTLCAFITDQSPVWEETQYWGHFLNQLTPVYLGIEKMAIKTGQAVVFLHVHKIARGKYEMEVIRLFDNVDNVSPYEITNKHLSVLEKIITALPEYWLWTHRRWKLTPRYIDYLNNQQNKTV